MSLVFCPECGHEVSLNAAACPNCAHPLVPAVLPIEPAVVPVERNVVVTPPRRESEFPTWALIPIGLLAIILIFVLYLAFGRGDDSANTNINVNVAQRRAANGARDNGTSTSTTSIPPTDVGSASVPSQPSSIPPQTSTVPGTSTSVAAPPPPDKGAVIINARVSPSRGAAQSVRNTRFYLLEDDIESILDAAGVEPIEGNTLTASLGLAAVYPERFGEFQRAAQRAIASKVKYSGTTDGSGKANLSGVEPKQYTLFGITKVGSGFALWNAPVSIVAGDNVLNLSPQSVTEIPRQ
ncbi:MAG: zinc-ribbon domain-containing protein [Pyrinomonadaceae bacterium]